MSTTKHTPASLAGRCANGYERDQGRRVHAVPTSDALLANGYCLTRAACGAKPGARSAGWSLRLGAAVTCPRCAKATGSAASCTTKRTPGSVAETTYSEMKDALRDLLDMWHGGHLQVRPEAYGAWLAAVQAGEDAISKALGSDQ